MQLNRIDAHVLVVLKDNGFKSAGSYESGALKIKIKRNNVDFDVRFDTISIAFAYWLWTDLMSADDAIVMLREIEEAFAIPFFSLYRHRP